MNKQYFSLKEIDRPGELIDRLHKHKPVWLIGDIIEDLFDPTRSDNFRHTFFVVASLCPSQTFFLQTSHPDEAAKYFSQRSDYLRSEWADTCDKIRQWYSGDEFVIPVPNVWLVVQANTQFEVDSVSQCLEKCPVAGRVLMLEPHESIQIPVNWLRTVDENGNQEYSTIYQWVFVKGGNYPIYPDWLRSLRDQCEAAHIPFYFDGWGKWVKCEEKDSTHWLLPSGLFAAWKRQGVPKNYLNSYVPIRVVGEKESGKCLDNKEHLQDPFNHDLKPEHTTNGT